MKILITGATGFLGGKIVEKILATNPNTKITATGRNKGKMLNENVDWKSGDLGDDNFVSSIFKDKYDFIIHCAALTKNFGKLQEFLHSNVKATENIICNLKNSENSKFIYISTPSIFSDDKNRYNITEDSSINIDYIRKSHYIYTKYLSEKLVKESQIQYSIIRPRAILGVGENIIWPKLMKANRKIGIPLFRKGEVELSYTNVDSVTNFIVGLIFNNQVENETFNLCDGSITFKEIFLLLKKYAKFNVRRAKINFNIIKFIFRIFPKLNNTSINMESLTLLYYDMTFDTRYAENFGFVSKGNLENIILENLKHWDNELMIWKK